MKNKTKKLFIKQVGSLMECPICKVHVKNVNLHLKRKDKCGDKINLKDFLADKGINVVEVEKLTKPDVIDLVTTITFRVSVKAADYEAALKPEVWPYRVGVRHYRPPRRPDRDASGWQDQSRQSGGNISSDNGGAGAGKDQGILG